MAKGDAAEDQLRYDREVRDEMAAYVGRSEAERYFSLFAPAIDYAGVRFYLERNP